MGTLLRGYAIELELHGRCVSLSLSLSLLFFLFRSCIVTTETYISFSSEWCKNLHLFLILLYMDWLLVAVQWVKLYGLDL